MSIGELESRHFSAQRKATLWKIKPKARGKVYTGFSCVPKDTRQTL
ncbi:hypothetical protein [Bartonella sp. OD88NMGDW]